MGACGNCLGWPKVADPMIEARTFSVFSRKNSHNAIVDLTAISGRLLIALISMAYIFGFRKENAIFFNSLGENYPGCVSLKRLCH